MFEKIVAELTKQQVGIEGQKILFNNPDYIPVPFNKKYFQPIKNQNSNTKTFFVDGGNASIIEGSNFCAQLIRLCIVGYLGDKRVFFEKKEFFALITTKIEDGKTRFVAQSFDDSFQPFSIDSYDSTIKKGQEQASINTVADMLRRFAEIDYATRNIEKVNGGLLVLDGSLKPTFNGEKEKIVKLHQKAKEQNTQLVGFCKTNTLFTDSGRSASFILSQEPSAWYYHPTAKINAKIEENPIIFFSRLHKKSNYIFKIETFSQNIESIANTLAINSSDPAFLGYPYGLVFVDKLARVTNRQKELYKTSILAKAKEQKSIIEQLERSTNAHNILDSIG
ncbi:DNA double-strand break repair nuclease NurA [Candidatus Woesearchaeota archaeon]|nr:DNA double-strand break repair nuclease NurA [Candidatus Woesearchaeota archaeon]